MRTFIHCSWILSAVAVSTAQPCFAQCTRWDPEFSGNGLTKDDPNLRPLVYAIAEFDDGSGPALFVGGTFMTAGGVSARNIAKWNGTSWSAPGSGMQCSPGSWPCEDEDPDYGGNGKVLSLQVFDDGSGPALYAGGWFSIAGGVSAPHIAKWNGSSWSSLGSMFDGEVIAMAVHDDGTGPALYVGGSFTSPGRNVAKWDGAHWSALGDGLGIGVYAFAEFDDGTGSALYAGGGMRAAKWDGNTWTSIGAGLSQIPRALTTFDDGSGLALYAAGERISGGSVVQRWNGTSWNPIGNGLTFMAFALAVFDDGTGPALYCGGAFIMVQGSTSNYLAKWDGTAWLPLGSGIPWIEGANYEVDALTVANFGSGPALYVGGIFGSAGGASAQNIAKWINCSPGFVQCFGDGFDSLVTTPCPCGNFGDRRNGCANSNSALGGAHLDATGTKSPNTVLLSCTGIPNGNLCTFLRSVGSNPSGAVFGDGVSCISGPVIRFGQQFAGQDWNEPHTVQAEPVAVAPGNTRYYAVQYRNPAPAFCPGGAFNVSNGYVIHW